MPLDIDLVTVTRRGSSPRHRQVTTLAAVTDADDRFVEWCAASKGAMLQKVDRYGDLVLTSSEMNQFIHEVRAVRPGAGPGALLVDEILDLARRCAADATCELHLQGD